MAKYYKIQFLGVRDIRSIIADDYEITGPIACINEVGLTVKDTNYTRAVFKLNGEIVAELNMNNVCGIFTGEII